MTDDDIVIAADGRRLRPVKSVARAIDLLDTLAADGTAMGVTELATAAGCSKTAAYNLITTLELGGLVRRTADNRYLLGWRLLELGDVVRVSSTFGAPARLALDELAELAGEAAILAVLDNSTVICVEHAMSKRSVATRFVTGRREPAGCDAAGQVLLAFASVGRRRRSLADEDAASLQRLNERFAEIRATGVAVVRDADEHRDVSIAAPVRDYSSEVVAALSLVGPSSRLPPRRVDELEGEVRRIARKVSGTLGASVRSNLD